MVKWGFRGHQRGGKNDVAFSNPAQTQKERVMNKLEHFIRNDEGQDTVEYALLAAFISIFAIVAIKAIGPLVNTIYVNVKNALTP
jgi:Flp pilus assembly pilin Flp